MLTIYPRLFFRSLYQIFDILSFSLCALHFPFDTYRINSVHHSINQLLVGLTIPKNFLSAPTSIFFLYFFFLRILFFVRLRSQKLCSSLTLSFSFLNGSVLRKEKKQTSYNHSVGGLSVCLSVSKDCSFQEQLEISG